MGSKYSICSTGLGKYTRIEYLGPQCNMVVCTVSGISLQRKSNAHSSSEPIGALSSPAISGADLHRNP